jgi:hypothetical protein
MQKAGLDINSYTHEKWDEKRELPWNIIR